MMIKNMTIKYILINFCFNILIVIDIFLITAGLIFQLPQNILTSIQFFDFVVCLILLIEYAYDLYKAPSKKEFIVTPMNIIGLIAFIPFDFILVTLIPGSILLRYLRLFKLGRVFLLSSRLKFIKKLCEKTGLHIFLLEMLVVIIIFTLLFYLFNPIRGGGFLMIFILL